MKLTIFLSVSLLLANTAFAEGFKQFQLGMTTEEVKAVIPKETSQDGRCKKPKSAPNSEYCNWYVGIISLTNGVVEVKPIMTMANLEVINIEAHFDSDKMIELIVLVRGGGENAHVKNVLPAALAVKYGTPVQGKMLYGTNTWITNGVEVMYTLNQGNSAEVSYRFKDVITDKDKEEVHKLNAADL